MHANSASLLDLIGQPLADQFATQHTRSTVSLTFTYQYPSISSHLQCTAVPSVPLAFVCSAFMRSRMNRTRRHGQMDRQMQDFHVHEVDPHGVRPSALPPRAPRAPRLADSQVELHLSELISPGAVAAELKKAAEESSPYYTGVARLASTLTAKLSKRRPHPKATRSSKRIGSRLCLRSVSRKRPALSPSQSERGQTETAAPDIKDLREALGQSILEQLLGPARLVWVLR